MSGTEGFKASFYTSQDGLKLFYRDYGPRLSPHPALIFLGGINRSSKDHHEVATRLGEKYRIICPDYRGRGQSAYDHDWKNYHPVTYLNDLRHLFVRLNLHRIIVIGTSMGGLLAMALSAFTPTILKGAVINDVGPDVSRKGINRIIDYLGDDTAYDNWDAAITHIKASWNDPSIKTEEDWLKHAQETFHQDPKGKIRIDWDPKIADALKQDTGESHNLWPLFQGFGSLPVLIIRGTESDILSQETFEKMAKTLPEAETLLVPKTGHTPRLDTPMVFEQLQAFLDKLTP